MLRDLPPLGPRMSHDDSIFMNGAPHSDPERDEVSRGAIVDPLSDVFGSAPSSPQISAVDISRRNGAAGAEHSDIPRLRSIHVTGGYREGIAVSKEKYIQAGFDEGYSLGGEIGSLAGWCLGVLGGIRAAARKKARSAAGEVGDEVLLERLETISLEAQDDLKMQSLFNPTHFGPDGIWLYDVPGQDASDEELQVTFKDVAAAHPVLKKWLLKITDLRTDLGLQS